MSQIGGKTRASPNAGEAVGANECETEIGGHQDTRLFIGTVEDASGIRVPKTAW
jgi:hypothetical protein